MAKNNRKLDTPKAQLTKALPFSVVKQQRAGKAVKYLVRYGRKGSARIATKEERMLWEALTDAEEVVEEALDKADKADWPADVLNAARIFVYSVEETMLADNFKRQESYAVPKRLTAVRAGLSVALQTVRKATGIGRADLNISDAVRDESST